MQVKWLWTLKLARLSAATWKLSPTEDNTGMFRVPKDPKELSREPKLPAMVVRDGNSNPTIFSAKSYKPVYTMVQGKTTSFWPKGSPVGGVPTLFEPDVHLKLQ